MRQFLIALPALVGLAATCAAQTPPRIEVGGRLQTSRLDDPRARYEEIEVLGRLLGRAVAGLAGGATNPGSIRWADPALRSANAYNPYPEANIDSLYVLASAGVDGQPHRFPGIYLRGHGIVYTRTLSQAPSRIVGDSTKPAPREMSAWERMRRELRGEKVEAERAKADAEATLSDTVLRVLAENGAHLSELPEAESVTVAFILPAPPAHAPAPVAGQRTTAAATTPAVGPPAGRNISTTAAAPSDAGSAQRAEARKLALLAELHAKQGQPQQALETYRKALELYAKAGGSELRTELEVLELRTKLARVLVELGRTDEARKVLEDAAVSVPRTAKAGTTAPAAGTVREVPLPARLIITVPKKALEQAGKVPFEEFRKAASIEYLTFSRSAEPAKTEPVKP